MAEFSLINNNRPNKEKVVNNQAKLTDFITTTKKWHLQDLKSILPDDLIDKIILIPISITNINEKIAWKFTAMVKFLLR